MEPDTRDQVVDFVKHWQKRSELPFGLFIKGLGIGKSKYYSWAERYGRVNFHNGQIPRDYWLADWEKAKIIEYAGDHLGEGYRSICYGLIDADLVAAAPATVWRILRAAGLLKTWTKPISKKGTGFVQPLKPHEHWHIDISYLNISGTFYYMTTILDGCSRYVAHWDIRESMTEKDIELILQRAKELFPEARPRIISDNGPQFIAKEFKIFVRQSGMTHVRTSLYYPQSNGKLERYHKTIKTECIRPKTPVSLEDAKRLVAEYVTFYNTQRRHSAIHYVTPLDKLEGRDVEILALRDQRLEAARARRKAARESSAALAA